MEPTQGDSEYFGSSREHHSDADLSPKIEGSPRLVKALIKYSVLAVVILVISFVAAYLLPENSPQSRENLTQRAIDLSDGLIPIFESSDAQLLTDFVIEQFEWDSGPPFINETALRGVVVQEIVQGLELPGYLYEDAHGGQITVYIISYRLLDERNDNLSIDESVLKQVAEEYQLVPTPSNAGTQAVMWREYSFLFLAVSTSDTPILMSRINPKRSP